MRPVQHASDLKQELTLWIAGYFTLFPDVTQLNASGTDICHLEFQVTDRAGQRIDAQTSKIHFDIQGPARFIGIGNGNLNDVESNQDPVHAVYQGRGLAIVQSGSVAGTVRIRASADGLEPASVALDVR